MHLRSLTLKGFKSFAQATTFAFEPGVTCIVGPNGSGKSNVVDSLAWVMGEQGAKNLRGGTMADVIFAGTATRGPLGRAEVVLTIDNADGALPIEYAEVAISRTLFRDGRSEYAINGESCRLLDLQELLSDSGLGREMHVIVGQGQLDAVLRATPDERRGFIEEAAGILKHRRRKERTLRKLEAMQANLTRLTDLADELRRQLKPLGAQAEIAREAAMIQAEVRQARIRVLAHDAARLAQSVATLEAEREHLGARRQVTEDAEQSLARRVAALEQSDGGAELDAIRRTALQLESVQERLRALAQSAATRVAMLAPVEAEPPPLGAAPGDVDRAAAAIEGFLRRLAAAEQVERAAADAVRAAQTMLDAVDARIAAQAADVAVHDRALARLVSAAAAAESRLQAARADVQRRGAATAAAEARAAEAAAALAVLPQPAVDADAASGASDPQQETDLTAVTAAYEAARAEVHRLERAQSAAGARLAALSAATATPPTIAEVLAAVPGSRRLQDVLEVDPAWTTAVGAALGPLLDAAVLPAGGDLHAAAEEVAALGGVDLVARAGAAPTLPAAAAAAGAISARDVVRAPETVLDLLAAVLLVDDLAQAAEVLVVAPAGATVVTRDGAVLTASRLRTPGAADTGVQLTAQREATAVEVDALAGQLRAARDAATEAQERLRSAQRAMQAANEQRRERERVSRLDDQRRATLVGRAESAAAESRRLAQQAAEAHAALQAATAAAAVADDELAAARRIERPAFDAGERPAAAAALDTARERSLAARLETGTLRERLRAEQARLAALQRRAAEAERAAVAAARRGALREEQRQAAEAVLAELPAWQASIDGSVTAARVQLADAERERAAANGQLAEARTRLAAARADLGDLGRGGRDLEMRLYEQQLSRAAVLERAAGVVGLDEAALAAEAVPDLDRAAEERRLATAERRLGRLGRVNPLALEEFAALEQRHTFLGEQLADLHRTRADLLRIVDDLDQRISTIFTAAYTDTEAAFARIFPVLFPGGAGRLSLTPADETGAAGVEVAVRPAGKKIERLSLLSGGERSLAAVAFLLAIFTARPSPFYILDEVEAALDDANLGRLLEVVSALRDASQLILITHQKRTMEIADALYGVSMREDGISTVIGQRMAART